MKKIILYILSAVVSLGLIACSNQEERVSRDESIKVDSKEHSKDILKKMDATNKKDNSIVNQSAESSKNYADNPYIVFDGYYYKKGSQVNQTKVGPKVGEVKRIGDWKIKKDGDSNEVPPGPIYSVIDQNPKDAIVAKQWSDRNVYVLFEREGPVIQPDKSTIFSAKNDPEEVQIAIQNVRENSVVLYEFNDKERLKLISVSYDPNHNSTVSLTYNVPKPDANAQGILSVMQYPKNEVPKSSEFVKKNKNKEWNKPILKKCFVVNGMEWNKYETFYHEVVYRGEQKNLYFEIKTQGEIDLNLMRDFLSLFEQSHNK